MANNISGSRRATMSSTSIPVPPPQSYIPDSANQPPALGLLSVSPLISGEGRSSISQLSSSAPSFSSLLSSERRSSHDASTRRDSTANAPALAIEFDGGTHIIVRPNRIVRGKFLWQVNIPYMTNIYL